MKRSLKQTIIVLVIIVSIPMFRAAPAYGVNWGGIVRDAVDTADKVADKLDKSSETPAQTAGQTPAANVEDLAKRANTLLRSSQNSMFSGKKEEALQQLNEAGELLVTIRDTDPENSQLKTLCQKYDKQRTDLGKRMSQEIPSKLEPEAAGKSPVESVEPTEPGKETEPADITNAGENKGMGQSMGGAPVAPGGKVVKLPYAARQAMDSFNKMNRTLEYNFQKLEKAKTEEQSMPVEERCQEIEKNMEEMKKILADAEEKAKEKGFDGHPDFVAAQAAIDAIPGRLNSLKKDVMAVKDAEQASASEKATDIAALKEKYDQLREKIFNKASGVAMYYNDLEPARELLATIEEYEKNEKEKAQTFLDAFAKKYGSTEDEIKAALDDWQPANTYVKFKEGMENVAKTRTAMAEDLVTKINQRLSGLADLHDFFRIERHKEIQEGAALAAAFDAENAKVKELAQTLDETLAADTQAFKKKVADRSWPEHASNAPKDAKKLAETALDWFKNSPDWGKRPADKEGRIPLAVVVTGPWSIQARNILGEPIMYGLPIKVAVQVPEEMKDGLARVYILTLRTEERKGVKAEPPFESATVGDSYFISSDKVE